MIGKSLSGYKITAKLGEGGMGVVWRATDERLGREVAIKVLPERVAGDAARLARFEREARVLASINHPNVAALHTLEEVDGQHLLVMELIEGVELAELIQQGPIEIGEAIRYADGVAAGLATAHDAGIVHRDLKPANVMITSDGQVKVLDFGLARADEGSSSMTSDVSATPTRALPNATAPGMILGTAAYMAPEQARGQKVDQTADVWAFGVVLWEMLTGARLFRGTTVSDLLAEVLKQEIDLSLLPDDTPPAIHRLLRRCLERDRKKRLHDLHDARLELGEPMVAEETVEPTRAPASRMIAIGFGVVGLVLGAVLSMSLTDSWSSTDEASAPIPTYKRLTFGTFAWDARFSPDGSSVYYSGEDDEGYYDINVIRIGSPISASLELGDYMLHDVSVHGEMLLKDMSNGSRLSRVALDGGSPRALAERVYAADWHPNGEDWVAYTTAESQARIIRSDGRMLAEDLVSNPVPRYSPDGQLIAIREAVEGKRRFKIIDAKSGETRLLGNESWNVINPFVWHPSGEEIWFSGGDNRITTLRAINLEGDVREILSLPSDITLLDIAEDGRVLVSLRKSKSHSIILDRHTGEETKLSWQRRLAVTNIADDASWVLSASDAGEKSSVWLWESLDGPPIRLGDGNPRDRSDDGRWVLTISNGVAQEIVLLPTGAGTERRVSLDLASIDSVYFLSGEKGLLVVGNVEGESSRLWRCELDGSNLEALTPPPSSVPYPYPNPLSMDGSQVVFKMIGSTVPLIKDLESGEIREVVGWPSNGFIFGFAGDGRIYMGLAPENTFELIDPKTGERELFDDRFADGGGSWAKISPDGRWMSYAVKDIDKDLYIIDNLQ